jgi:hypothetical protein
MAAKSPSRRAQVSAGLLAMTAGLGVTVLAASHLGKAVGKLDPVIGLIAGLTLVFVGAILVVPERNRNLRTWFGALMITSIALLFDWLAFGPGERRVTNGIASASNGVRTHFWEVPGQILFASGLLLFNLMAWWAWMRALWGKPARA